MGRQFRIIKYKKGTARIPDIYQEVEYLLSTGTQIINTGVMINSLTAPHIKTKFQALSGNDVDYFGTNNNAGNTIIWNLAYPGTAYIRWGSIGSVSLTYESGKSINDFNCLNEPKTLEITTTYPNTGNYYIDGEKIAISQGTSFESNLPILINSARNPASARWYTFQIYDGDTLLRDYVPCYKKNSLETGMYDLVTETFYASTTSPFIVGPTIIDYKWIEALVQQGDSIGHMLPAAYQEVEYLESTGTQYLDSGVKPSATIGVDCDIYYTEINTENMALGVSTANSYIGGTNYVLDVYQNKVMMSFGEGSATHASSGKQIISGVGYHMTMNLNGDKSIYCDGILQTTNNNPLNFPDYNIFIFGRSINGSKDNIGAYIFKGRFYSLKMYDGETLIRNFIPCYRLSDSKPGMYDLVNNVFYINQATGTDFSVGPDIHTTPKFSVIETYKED